MDNFSTDGMSRVELINVRARVELALATFRPYRIKERLVRCGRTDCWCFESDERHGPYLYAMYRKGGKTKSESLGPKMDIGEIVDSAGEQPVVWSYLSTPNHVYKKMPVEAVEGWCSLELSGVEFKSRYGVSAEEDNFSRATKFWGPGNAFSKYSVDVDLYHDLVSLRYNKWLVWGVGTLQGVAKLTALETEGYYQK